MGVRSTMELNLRRLEMTQRILIIGAGFAGMWSALSAARLLDQTRKDKACLLYTSDAADE